ncbi:MAG: response regulator transcription factor [Phycisphaerales bacterium]|nr:response regulator transcription factor [Phycisphaerales bacterium]
MESDLPVRPAKSLLIVEDEADLAELLRFNLEKEGYACQCAGDGQTALRKMQAGAPDLLILDRMLPGMSGDELMATMKRDPRYAKIPVIMLTAKAEESDELVGFALGADDYITKPFSIKRVLARVAALFRGRQIAETTSQVVVIGPVSLDAGRHEVCVEGQPVAVTAAEFRLLKVLMSARGRVLSREQLIDMVMGVSVAVTDRVIDVHVSALRKKLGPAAGWVHTIRGVGYAFRPPLAEE